jgi:hypothetical protein
MASLASLSIYELIPSNKGKSILNDTLFNISSKFIVSATTEKEAREIAQQNSYGDECYSKGLLSFNKCVPFWTDSKYSTCRVVGISNEKNSRIIANVFSAG